MSPEGEGSAPVDETSGPLIQVDFRRATASKLSPIR